MMSIGVAPAVIDVRTARLYRVERRPDVGTIDANRAGRCNRRATSSRESWTIAGRRGGLLADARTLEVADVHEIEGYRRPARPWPRRGGRRVQDLLIDERWVARYFVLLPGAWLARRLVISPIAIAGIDWVEGRVDIRLTRRQVGESPDLLAVEPLTREAEAQAAKYYEFPAYWGGPELWAWAGRPGALGGVPPVGYAPPPPPSAEATSKLRSARSFRGRHLVAADGEIGHVDHCIFDDDSWTMPYVVVDTSNWIGDRHVIGPTEAGRDT
jgi:hypothetical protein